MLWVMKNVVLLHPLSERERGRGEASEGSDKFIESLRPAQEEEARRAPRGGRTGPGEGTV